MSRFDITDIAHLETAGSRDSLGSKIERMISNSASVNARVEKIAFDTGEYAVVLRGVLRTDNDQEIARPVEPEPNIHLDTPERYSG